ncbi:MAG TPA: DUF2163 domain-containing protein [Xanthobacteraceae bacterium]|nr:DUF2163 domain-containing protein [Xanthobacteraceae bacterium]
MRTFDSGTLASLAAGHIVARGLVLFDFDSGLYGFWDGYGTLTFNGVDYVGAGSLISVDPISMVSDLSAVPLVLRLTAVPNSDLTPDTLATIEGETYHQRPVTIYRAYMDIDTRALISVEKIYRGYLDRIDHDQNINGNAQLVVNLESKARDNTKHGFRNRDDADQKTIDSNDGGLSHAVMAASLDIFWGRATPASQTSGGVVTGTAS